MEYLTLSKIMLIEGNRVKSESFDRKTLTPHHGIFGHVKSYVRTRLIDPQIMIMFFNFDTKLCDFSDYVKLLNIAINKIG